MATLRILRGIPGSGKSTHAFEWLNDAPERFRSNRDDLRMSHFGRYVLSKEEEDRITKIQHADVDSRLAAGFDVVVDDTNLRASAVKEFLKIAHKHGAKVEHQDFPIDVNVAVRRNAERAAKGGHDVPEKVIRSFYDRYLRKGRFPDFPELSVAGVYGSPVEYIPGLPEAYLVDIDGTVAHGHFEEESESHKNGKRRKPFDWDRVDEDDPAWDVINTVKALREAGKAIIFMSAREDICREKTQEWLEFYFDHEIEHLYMRKTNDKRQDSEAKAEMFDTHIRGKFNIVACFDDRNQVVNQYRAMGLTVFQVADGDF